MTADDLAVAVAETGTLVLDGSADQGRRVISLIPDYHLCVVRSDQVVADVRQAVALLEGCGPGPSPRPEARHAGPG